MARYDVDKLLTEHTSDVTIGAGGAGSDKAVLYRIADEDITGVYLADNSLLLTVDKPVFLALNSPDGKHSTESDKVVVFLKDYMLSKMLTMEKRLGRKPRNVRFIGSIYPCRV